MKEIRQIIQKYDQADLSEEKLALASVVNVEESSYRRIGARMLVSTTGHWIGGISGGCLEGDALRRSQQAIYKNESSIIVYDTMDDDSNQIGVGLGCNGRLEVLFNPIDPLDSKNSIEQLRKAVKLNKPTLILTIIDSKVNKNEIGRSQLVETVEDQEFFFNIDKSVINEAVEICKRKRTAQIIETENGSDRLKILIEYLRPETKLVLIGDNYDVNAFIGIAFELGWEIHVVGRKKKLSKTVFEKTKRVYEYEEFDSIEIDDYTAVVLMTHDYNWDKKILPQVLKKKPSYIGILGPKKRMEKMSVELNISDLNKYSFFHSPVGLDIGAESPEEIALSIASEIVAVFRSRQGTFLKDRKGTIHERK